MGELLFLEFLIKKYQKGQINAFRRRSFESTCLLDFAIAIYPDLQKVARSLHEHFLTLGKFCSLNDKKAKDHFLIHIILESPEWLDFPIFTESALSPIQSNSRNVRL